MDALTAVLAGDSISGWRPASGVRVRVRDTFRGDVLGLSPSFLGKGAALQARDSNL